MENIQIHGFDEFDKKLHLLPEKVAKKILRQATVEAAKIIANEADRLIRSKVHVGHRGRTTWIKTSQHYSEVTCHISPSKKKWYLKFFETGTVVSDKVHRALKHTAKIKSRIALRVGGHWRIAPRPWLRPALDASKHKAIVKLGEELGTRITIEATSQL